MARATAVSKRQVPTTQTGYRGTETKIVFKEFGDKHPDINADDSKLAVSSGEGADSWTRAGGTMTSVTTEVTSLLVKLSLLGTDCALQTIRNNRD